MKYEREDLPVTVRDYLDYLEVTKNRSLRTVDQYQIDLILFSKYLKGIREMLPMEGEDFDTMPIRDLPESLYAGVTVAEINGFLTFAMRTRNNSARTRNRKLSSLRGFYRFCTVVTRRFPNNPVRDIESPKSERTLPKYLTEKEAETLLETVLADEESRSRLRDYAILTLFLNGGMRVSELVGINLRDISPDFEKLLVTGKGAKQRIIYLNEACREVLTHYLKTRGGGKPIQAGHEQALFLSNRNQRISVKTVQWMVYKYLDAAGLGYRRLSVHKLRHTAATLLYQTGKVDLRVLKDILGHEQLNTTQIYTHVSDESMKKAMEENPLSKKKSES